MVGGSWQITNATNLAPPICCHTILCGGVAVGVSGINYPLALFCSALRYPVRIENLLGAIPRNRLLKVESGVWGGSPLSSVQSTKCIPPISGLLLEFWEYLLCIHDTQYYTAVATKVGTLVELELASVL